MATEHSLGWKTGCQKRHACLSRGRSSRSAGDLAGTKHLGLWPLCFGTRTDLQSWWPRCDCKSDAVGLVCLPTSAPATTNPKHNESSTTQAVRLWLHSLTSQNFVPQENCSRGSRGSDWEKSCNTLHYRKLWLLSEAKVQNLNQLDLKQHLKLKNTNAIICNWLLLWSPNLLRKDTQPNADIAPRSLGCCFRFRWESWDGDRGSFFLTIFIYYLMAHLHLLFVYIYFFVVFCLAYCSLTQIFSTRDLATRDLASRLVAAGASAELHGVHGVCGAEGSESPGRTSPRCGRPKGLPCGSCLKMSQWDVSNDPQRPIPQTKMICFPFARRQGKSYLLIEVAK